MNEIMYNSGFEEKQEISFGMYNHIKDVLSCGCE